MKARVFKSEIEKDGILKLNYEALKTLKAKEGDRIYILCKGDSVTIVSEKTYMDRIKDEMALEAEKSGLLSSDDLLDIEENIAPED